MATREYLNETGLGLVWNKIKDYADPFVVTITSTIENGETIYSANKTHTEILAAYNAGKICLAKESNMIYVLFQVVSSSNLLRFSSTYTYSNNQNTGKTLGTKCLTISNSNVITINTITTISRDTVYERFVKYEVLGIKNNGSVNGNYSIATDNYLTGELFTINSLYSNTKLVKAINSINTGDTLIENTNYIETTLADELNITVSYATISEIEEMCNALGFQSVTIDTSDYVNNENGNEDI